MVVVFNAVHGNWSKKRQAIQTKQTLEKVIFFQGRAKQKADIDKKTKTLHWHNYVYSVQILFLNTYVTQHSVTVK